MRRVIIDIETRSDADLKKVGIYAYASSRHTSITHIGWKNSAYVQVWQPGQPMPSALVDALGDETVTLVAHNAGFERLMLSGPPGQAIGVPAIVGLLERWDCTAARGAQAGLPRPLD